MTKINELLSKAIKNKKSCIFISPHLDDAALSCGGLISYLSGKVPISIVNIFTKAGNKPYTLSAKEFLRKCGYKNAKKLFRDRKREDQNAFRKYKVSLTNLNFVDASFRKKKSNQLQSNFIAELSHIYPTHRFHVTKGKVSDYDAPFINSLAKKLRGLIKDQNCIVFCPYGVGKHVDHLITRNICQAITKQLILWSDFPYNEKFCISALNELTEMHFSKNQDKRKKMIKNYKSQFKTIFPNGFGNLEKETYFVNRNTYKKWIN